MYSKTQIYVGFQKTTQGLLIDVNASAEEVRGILLSLADLSIDNGKEAVARLEKPDGSYIPINSKIPANDINEPYNLIIRDITLSRASSEISDVGNYQPTLSSEVSSSDNTNAMLKECIHTLNTRIKVLASNLGT